MPTTSGVYHGRFLDAATSDIKLGNEASTTTIDSNTTTKLQVADVDRITCSSSNVVIDAPSVYLQRSGITKISVDAVGASLSGSLTQITSTKTKISGMLLDANNHALDCPGSRHISGDSATEVRRITITPDMAMADNDSNGGGNGITNLDEGAHDPFLASNETARYVNGTHAVNGNSELFVFVSGNKIPFGWKAVGIRLNLINRTTNPASGESKEIACTSRSIYHSGLGTNIKTDYLTQHLSINSGTTNVYQSFVAPFIDNDNYLICYIGVSSQYHIFTGGYLKLQRV